MIEFARATDLGRYYRSEDPKALRKFAFAAFGEKIIDLFLHESIWYYHHWQL
jgi:hypothetical protein